MDGLQAGISQINITPPTGTWLVGCEGPSTGVHDPLFATVLVLQQGDVRHALISLDLCGLAQEDSRAIRNAVAQACNTAPDRVTLMCSHTHSAPISIPWSLTGWQQHCAQDQAWTSALPQRVAQAAQEAGQHMSPALLGYARAQVQIGQNRRYGGYTPGTQAVMQPDPDGSLVPWSDILAIREPEGRLRAVLYSQAAHPVMVHKASPMISADYPVFSGQRIRERLGKDVMPLFAQGCGADNNAPWATGFDVCEQAGIQLGDAVAQACAQTTPISAPIHSESLVFDLPLKPLPSEAELEQAIRTQEQLLAHMEQALNISDKDVPLVLREQLQMVRNGSAPKDDADGGAGAGLRARAGDCGAGQRNLQRLSTCHRQIQPIPTYRRVGPIATPLETTSPPMSSMRAAGTKSLAGRVSTPIAPAPQVGAEKLILGACVRDAGTGLRGCVTLMTQNTDTALKERHDMGDGYTLARADTREFVTHANIYRDGPYNVNTVHTWDLRVSMYTGWYAEHCYWLLQGSRRIGGVAMAANELFTFFLIPPYVDALPALKKVKQTLVQWSDPHKRIQGP